MLVQATFSAVLSTWLMTAEAWPDTSFKERAAAARASMINQATGTERLHVNSLVNRTVVGPVTVKGKFGITVVSGSTVANPGHVTDSLLELQCPRLGSRIVFRGSRVFNDGTVTDTNGNGSAVVTYTCDSGSTKRISSTGNVLIHNGKLR